MLEQELGYPANQRKDIVVVFTSKKSDACHEMLPKLEGLAKHVAQRTAIFQVDFD